MKFFKKHKSDLIVVCCVIAFMLALVLVLRDPKDNPSDGKGKYLTGKHYVEMEVENYGKIQLELDADTAPITVTNFVNLVNDKFYDGLTFHRIMEGFMMQGGDPEGTGLGGSPNKIKGEFSANGVKNDISHVRGVISMARGGYSMDSASSQFFIVHKDAKTLDGQYAAFGKVISGIEVVDKVCEEAEPTDNNGTIPSAAQPVIKYIKVIEKPATAN